MSGVQWQWLHSIIARHVLALLELIVLRSATSAGLGPGSAVILRSLFGATIFAIGLSVRRNATTAFASSSVMRL